MNILIIGIHGLVWANFVTTIGYKFNGFARGIRSKFCAFCALAARAFHFSFARTKEKRNKKKIRRLHFFTYSGGFLR